MTSATGLGSKIVKGMRVKKTQTMVHEVFRLELSRAERRALVALVRRSRIWHVEAWLARVQVHAATVSHADLRRVVDRRRRSR